MRWEGEREGLGLGLGLGNERRDPRSNWKLDDGEEGERERERESRIGSGSMEAIRINRECRDGKTQSRVSLSRIEAEQEELSTQSDHSDQ